MKRSFPRITLFLAALALLASPGLALDPIVYSGSDLWITPGDGTTFADFSHIPVPADFFCSGSQPFTGKIVFEGVPLTTKPAAVLGRTDTIVHRLDDAVFDRNGLATTRIQMAAMEFQGIQPFRNECGTFRVGLVLEGPQPITEMRIQRLGPGFGTFEADISVNIKMTFTPVDHKGPEMALYRDLAFAPSVNVWSSDHGETTIHHPGFIHVDTDSDRVADTFIVGTSRNFIAGFAGNTDRREILQRGAFARNDVDASGSLRAGSRNIELPEQGVRSVGGQLATAEKSISIEESCPGGCHCSDDCGIHCPVAVAVE